LVDVSSRDQARFVRQNDTAFLTAGELVILDEDQSVAVY
jgi:hypothetical protein